MRFCLSISAALILGVAGCERALQPAPQAKAEPVFVAPGGFPQEPDKAPAKPIATPRVWRATGLDEVGRRFEGYLSVETAPDAYLCHGYFEWTSQQGGGRYHFEGTFDPDTRRVRWTGYCIEDRFKVPAMATYEAALSADARRFEKGCWSGGISVPGTWEAEVVGE